MDEKMDVDNALTEFQELIQKPEVFLNYDESFSCKIKSRLKASYDMLKSAGLLSTNALPQLLIKDFETEQIWQQVELQNEDFSKKSIANVSKVILNKVQLVFCNLLDNKDNINSEEETDDCEDGKSSSDEEYESEKDSNEISHNSETKIFNDEEIGDAEDDDDKSQNVENKNHFKKSIVDDEFFKLDEMESFLRAEENKLDPSKNPKTDEESDSDEGSIDLFKSDSDDDESVRKAKFKDFFVSKTEDKMVKRNKFLEEMDSDNEIPKSTFELRQERLQKKIEKIEETAISEKPWTLQGEITADSRPQNSLLEEVVEFDLTSKPAPVITQNVTHQLEDIIRHRIKEKHFDSVERKEKPVETLLEYKKKLVLDQEKSKHSLAQIYEKEFLDQQMALDPENAANTEEEPKLHKEIKMMMKDLFNKLDALSNFHFTPKPAVPELKIVTNLPAVVMEEVAPVAVSDAALLAPEEIKNKTKGDILGKSERIKTDKNRERRKKKLKQKLHAKKTINKNMLPDKKSKKQMFKKGNNTQKMKETLDKKSFRSSTAFFTQLQEQVQSSIKEKISNKSKVRDNKQLSAKKLKL